MEYCGGHSGDIGMNRIYKLNFYSTYLSGAFHQVGTTVRMSHVSVRECVNIKERATIK